MHALIIFILFVLIETLLVFSIKKDRRTVGKLTLLLKDENEQTNKEELAASVKGLNKKILVKSIIVVAIIFVLYILL